MSDPLDDQVRALLEGEQRLRIAMPDHPIRRNRWFQMFVRLPRPALEWVTVASVGYAGIIGPAIQRPLGDGYLVQILLFAGGLFGVRALEKIKGVA
ncbi:MAG: hypothetical protein KA533_07400 [Sphingobium sp.]|nr:hypothetical protein [Sphingobium sp.]MBP6111711.1 hypothetical protein [Sphingobium sp.]MBP8671608.1 hypothetical protein [Sphingobium sp.]MBP9158628.1 hypothetical protein [Sphingobium sp.]